MKKLIFTIAFFTVCVTADAQVNKDTVGLNLPITAGRVIYTGVVEAAGKTKADLYRNAQQWLIDAFYNQNGVIQDKDKDAGLVFGQGVFNFSMGVELGSVNWINHFTIKIECRDNKYRYSFYNIVINYAASGNTGFDIEQVLGILLGTQKWPLPKKAASKVLVQNDVLIKNVILSLKNAMATTTSDF